MTAAKKYMISFGLSMGAYTIVLMVAMTALNRLPIEAMWMKALIAVSPMLPIAFAMKSYLDFIRQMDELEKRIQFEAGAISLLGTGVITFTWGLLERAGFPAFHSVLVFPLMIFLWGLGQWWTRRRY